MSKKAILALLSSLVGIAGIVVLVVTLTAGPAPTAMPAPNGEQIAVRGGISVAIAVEAQAEGEVPGTTAGYTLRLTAEENAPMPTAEQVYDLHMPGPGTATFPAITFDTLGVYHYHLSLLPEQDAGATYDDAQYLLTISVLRDEGSDEWYTMMTIRDAETRQKTDVPVFIIAYPEPEATPTATPTVTPTATPTATPTVTPTITPAPTDVPVIRPATTPTATPTATPTETPNPTPTPEPATTSVTVRKVWNDNNDASHLRPASLRVTLSNGMSVTLSAANGWSATISDLPAENNGQPITYTWQEAEPLGYIQTGYTVNGNVTTITNSLWQRPTPPPSVRVPVPNDPTINIDDYGTPLSIGVEINHVGDTFD